MASIVSNEAVQYYQALVDMGSNGIRFSISDMSPPSSRTIPTIYQDRSGISLYDAQFSSGTKAPIPDFVIKDVLAALQRFKRTCHDFCVPHSNIRVVATEATRNAINRDDLLSGIEQQTGWKVQLLAKEEEGRLGAMGIASSVHSIKGLCLDMGGGSVQLTWVVKRDTGHIDIGPSVSFPYGAAALMAELGTREKVNLQEEISRKLQNAIKNDLEIPQWLWDEANRDNGFNLYLSGGGFRGWGHLLMCHDKIQPYPIPIINGYGVSGSVFFSDFLAPLEGIRSHRISPRRASQVPAIKLIIGALAQAQLQVLRATFAQGGVREGLLYDSLPHSIRAQNALVAATVPYAPPSAAAFIKLLECSIPSILSSSLLFATAHMLYLHGPIPKDIRASAALRSTTSGILASANGLSHYERGMLALILCERWDAGVPDTDTDFLKSMVQVCGAYPSWWAKFVGRMAKGIANLYPAGLVRQEDQKISLNASFTAGDGLAWSDVPRFSELQGESCQIKMTILSHDIEVVSLVNEWAKDLTKLGKKKSWVDGTLGLSVSVDVVQAMD